MRQWHNLKTSPERFTIIAAVILLHLAFLYVLVTALVVHATKPVAELEVSIGGPIGAKTQKLDFPKLIEVTPPTPPPPTIPVLNAGLALGASNITVPAEAIAQAHGLPTVPAALHSGGTKIVRLLLTIETDGSVRDAQIAETSGSPALDLFARKWVETHWRYRPALRNGEPISVTTTAIIVLEG